MKKTIITILLSMSFLVFSGCGGSGEQKTEMVIGEEYTLFKSTGVVPSGDAQIEVLHQLGSNLKTVKLISGSAALINY